MSILNRDLSKSEKNLLVVLVIVIIGAAYYLFVYTPIENGIHSAQVEQQALQTELEVTNAKVEKIKEMTEELSGKSTARASYMPSYNAGKQELDFLHEILRDTSDYSVKFTGLTRNKDLIRREFSMKFSVRSYAKAKEVVKALENCDIRCLVADAVVSPVERDSNLQDGDIDVNLTGTFYETLQGGKPDKDLPEDEDAK